MLQKLSVSKFEWIEDTSQFNEDFINNYNEGSDKGHFIKFGVRYPENYMNFIMIYQLNWKSKNVGY